MANKTKSRAGLLASLLMIVAACGGGTSSSTTSATTAAPNAGTSILISGSSTVEPISALVGEAFQTANPEIGVTVEGPGTGDGFARFCAGETDISDASRPINDEEVASCEANGVTFVELHIATDGISVITSPNNADVSCLNFPDLYALLGPESEGFTNWSDADALAAEVGGVGSYPAAPLVVVGPGEESGTYDTFVEFVIADLAEERGADEATRADYQASANDNVIVDNISGNDSSLGWVGYAFFEENSGALKALEVDGGDGCVAPSAESIATFEYPMSRPLFIYVNTGMATEKAALVDFVDFYLSAEGIAAVDQAGYVDLPAEEFEATVSAWEAVK